MQPNVRDYELLKDEVAWRVMDRVCDIKRSFPLALDLGCGRGHMGKVSGASRTSHLVSRVTLTDGGRRGERSVKESEGEGGRFVFVGGVCVIVCDRVCACGCQCVIVIVCVCVRGVR
jgi:hypothetical protein